MSLHSLVMAVPLLVDNRSGRPVFRLQDLDIKVRTCNVDKMKEMHDKLVILTMQSLCVIQ